MEPFRQLAAVAVPFAMANADTDQITPARFLWRPRRDGYSDVLFYDLRYQDGAPKPDFILNRSEYRGAKILVAGVNFGCGSSREHAVWSLYDYGFRAVIAPSFGDIFFNNCFKIGLLPIVLPAERVVALRRSLELAPGTSIGIDLERQTVRGPDGAVDSFEVDPFRKEGLLAGVDEIDLTLSYRDRIETFEAHHQRNVSWI